MCDACMVMMCIPQIDLFIQAIEMNPAVVSLKGYADVNRELLASVNCHVLHEFDSVLMEFPLCLSVGQHDYNLFDRFAAV